MKAFMILGIGFYNPEKKSWSGVGLNVSKDIDIPPHIQIPGVPEGMDPKNVEVTIVGMEAITDPKEGMNPITGFLVCSSREVAEKVIRDVRDGIESGKYGLVKEDEKESKNPIDDFIFKQGTKDFFAKN